MLEATWTMIYLRTGDCLFSLFVLDELRLNRNQSDLDGVQLEPPNVATTKLSQFLGLSLKSEFPTSDLLNKGLL